MIGRILPLIGFVFLSGGASLAQNIALDNLQAFKSPTSNWQIVGNVTADFRVKEQLRLQPGTGILANQPLDPKLAKDIYTLAEHGDADIELEFLMAKGSNSGIYLQGRYEIQLLDSWGKASAGAGDCGGIYERWEESRPDGAKGYEGYAPRLNASRAPGLWQQLRISFQAPRFDAGGKKTENARIIRVQLNGLTIHENVELTGPTRGGMNNDEVARGPLRFQGDHGPVAFRNLKIHTFDNPKPAFRQLTYEIHDGRVVKPEELASLKPVKKGDATLIDHSVSNFSNNYVIRYTGKITIPAPGKYRFRGIYSGGYGQLTVNNQTVFPFSWSNNSREVELPAGELSFEYSYSKVNEGDRPSLGLLVEGPGIRTVALHEPGSVRPSGSSNPIYLEPAREALIHRSFIDFNGQRLPYGVSVGDPSGINYSLNLANGALIRTWRGDFLNVTPMWNDRGNGTSVPLGSPVDLAVAPQITTVAGAPAGQYLFKGYQVDPGNHPAFLYEYNATGFEDRIVPDDEQKYLVRTLKTVRAGTSFSFDLAKGKRIETLPDNTFLIDGAYYIQVTQGGSPVVAEKDGSQTLSIQTSGSLSYALIW